jgi:transposase-like protein
MARYEAVKKMHREGHSISAIARQLGMHAAGRLVVIETGRPRTAAEGICAGTISALRLFIKKDVPTFNYIHMQG